jgi:hypothetical protein
MEYRKAFDFCEECEKAIIKSFGQYSLYYANLKAL